jgi:hypothetical protein
MSLQPIFIAGSDAGLQLDKKPFMLTDKAFSNLENAYVWRERVLKRQGNDLIGRLRRFFQTIPIVIVSGAQFNIYTALGLSNPPETTAEIDPGSVIIVITIGPITVTDQGNGTLTSVTPGVSGVINYLTGNMTITGAAGAGTISAGYSPGLPVMGILLRELATINDEETIFFDTKYAYIFSGTGFQEFIAGTTWTGTDYDFFWPANYRGINAFTRLFFVTNFNLDIPNLTYDPIRFTDGGTWTDFAPYLSQATPANPATDIILYQAKIIIPYYGRLLALNTWEGTVNGTYIGSQNYFNRCRFSQIGNPLESVVAAPVVDLAWRSDLFGRGGFIDAPTNEAIISAAFFKNTLVVFFERSTWQLRYVGEYGLPFLWERISSDYGSESKNSIVIFDQGVAAVGDKAIVSSNSINVQRIDEQIPDLVFDFRNSNQGVERVNGIRDFQRQIVFWNYADPNMDQPTPEDPSTSFRFPSKVLVYNYINNTYAIFRDNVTCFGIFQPNSNITWSRNDIFWYDDEVFWKDFDTQSLFPSIVIGNQEGFILSYGYNTFDDPGLSITAIDLTGPVTLTIVNHNLESGEILYLTNINFLNGSTIVPTSLNNNFFQVTVLTTNLVELSQWDTVAVPHEYVTDFVYTPALGAATYVGGGRAALMPKMDIQTKDFNPFQDKGYQVKIGHIDFQTDVPGAPDAAMTVNLLLNSSPIATGNVLVGNTQVEQFTPQPYYLPGSDYAWHRFYATSTGQYIKLQMTFDDDLMNQLSTHTSGWTLNAISLWVRPGARTPYL